jgi:hypothetical protein
MACDFMMLLAKKLSEIYFKRSVDALENKNDPALANQLIQKASQFFNQAIDFNERISVKNGFMLLELADEVIKDSKKELDD